MSTVGTEPIAEQAVLGEPVGAVLGRTPWQLFWARFKKDRVAFVGLGFIAILAGVALGAPLISKYVVHHGPNVLYPYAINYIGIPIGPNAHFWFGADQDGRDLFVRTIYGARTSLTVALLATGLSVFFGVILGTVAGFYGGAVDTLISRTIDIVMSLPILLFAVGIAAVCSITAQGCLGGHFPPAQIGVFLLIIAGILFLVAWRSGLPLTAVRQGPAVSGYSNLIGMVLVVIAVLVIAFGLHVPRIALRPGLTTVVFIIALVNWTYIARIVRGQTLSLREREFIESARALGAANGRIIFREVLPNLAAPIIVYSTLIIPSNILFEAALSFLGVGIPQSTPSWGQMLSKAQDYLTIAPWMMIFPGVALLLTTLAFNLVGDGLRDALDPRAGR